MNTRPTRHGLELAVELEQFVEQRVLPGTGISAGDFWRGYAEILAEFMPENRKLLNHRGRLQSEVDKWHKSRRGQAWDQAAYRAFLTEIGYLQPAPPSFKVSTPIADPEIAGLAAPQLVVPVNNARFALNAANARWGSLYDALFGSDALGEPLVQTESEARRKAVVARVAQFLDETFPLVAGSHASATSYCADGQGLCVTLPTGQTRLVQANAFVGHRTDGDAVTLVLRHHGLHVQLIIDPTHPVGALSASGLRDVILEAALTAIQDCEDSVAAVDASDKIAAYSNWLGLMQGNLSETFEKSGKPITRRLADDIILETPAAGRLTLPGRAVLLVRNVGLLMTTDAVRVDGEDTPEGILDAMITVACALHDLQRKTGPRNSRAASIYVVKPKLHGPDEAAFTDRLFGRVEQILGLAPNTVKLGLMDEERRTSANLAGCIYALRHRLAFINTGFLDRTGDEIHTSMQAGPFVGRDAMKAASWLDAYEARNVAIGMACGLLGKGQIGKGMWAKPDAMRDMLIEKVAHTKSGASTAWVPSPTAATLHALHYHQIDVSTLQAEMAGMAIPDVDLLLTPALMTNRAKHDEILREVDNNCQGILGYVVRWVDHGIGCSKVPNIDDVQLMEDRATCRISAQYLANWLLHGLVTPDDVDAALRRMAVKVDVQNASDPSYLPMAPGFKGRAFLAARSLVFNGATEPSGYTEPTLHAHRREFKAERAST